MRITVLGCGDAFASGGRYPTSFLIHAANQNILLDCGASTLVRLKQMEVPVTSIQTIVLTHFHGDHYGGLPFLLLSNLVEYARKQTLTIIGPKGVEERVKMLQEALYPGTGTVFEQLNVAFLEYEKDQWLQHKDVSVLAKEVVHAPPSLPHGVKLAIDGKTIGFSGDTTWTHTLIPLAEGTDLFILECNNLEDDSAAHLSYRTILRQKKFLKTRRLVLSHMGTHVLQADDLEIEQLHDGMVVEL